MTLAGTSTASSTRTQETQPATKDALARSAAVVVAARLNVVVEGGQPCAGSTRHTLFEVDRVLLNRGEGSSCERVFRDGASTLVVRIPDPRMSSHHALIQRDGSLFTIEDLDSRNGTRVNGARIAGRVPLVEGDIVELGQTILLYRAATLAPCDAPADFDTRATARATTMTTLNAALAERVARLDRIAASLIPVLILGETGTGKEVTARAIHRMSRRQGAFVAVNCGALPASLVEAQLFGHVRGSFSGAVADSPGLLRAAHGGTLFLDEIGDLPLPSQAALLRVLEESEVTPVGGVRPIPVDLRVVAATHRGLEEAVVAGHFRSDLFARLAGFTFHLPPLRDRPEDMGLILATLMGTRPLTLGPDVGRSLLRYHWPHNVRELRHALDVARTLAPVGTIRLEHLPAAVAASSVKAAPGAHPIQEALVASLTRHRGNISAVARDLGKARIQVQRWMRRFGLDPRSFRH